MLDYQIFVPPGDSEAVEKLKLALGLSGIPVKVKTNPEPNARERNCFEIVEEKVRRDGGRTQLGWAVWQHGNLFIEGEFHAVYDPGEDGHWIDCTPRSGSFQEILFLADPKATYDLASTDVIDNCRVPLLPDPRVEKALSFFTEKAALLNSVPGINVPLTPDVIIKIANCEQKAFNLLERVLHSQRTGSYLNAGTGRNEKVSVREREEIQAVSWGLMLGKPLA